MPSSHGSPAAFNPVQRDAPVPPSWPLVFILDYNPVEPVHERCGLPDENMIGFCLDNTRGDDPDSDF